MTAFLFCIAMMMELPGIEFIPVLRNEDFNIQTVSRNGSAYSVIYAEGFCDPGIITEAGTPSLPCRTCTYLLMPDTEIESIDILSADWDTVPGRFCIIPCQSRFLDDTVFTEPLDEIYSSSDPWPQQPLTVSRQGSAMGYSVASITGTPFRYIPRDSLLLVLKSIELDIHIADSSVPRIFPRRQTAWSAAVRERGIRSLVVNPDYLQYYPEPELITFGDRSSALSVTGAPSMNGDAVDMVIITSEELEDDFQALADYRTRQGIVTIVRTLEWIYGAYGGCDLPQRIRSFIQDAHDKWGIQGVILGGDSHIVPIRECNGWQYYAYPYPIFQMPSDDYYGDIDGDWSFSADGWHTDKINRYLDLCVGRWPVDDGSDVEVMLCKLQLYEDPDSLPPEFARRLLFMAVNDVCGSGADNMILLRETLEAAGAIPEYLDEPTELYFPHSLPEGDLCRANALSEMDQGYNIILHADHSETHKLATAGKFSLGQFIWDSDFSTMVNYGRPSILWTLGCGPGQFDGADCFAEAGLLTSPSSGLTSAIANARYGLHNQSDTYYYFFDALFNTGYMFDQTGLQSLDWPLNYLGEAHRCSKNLGNSSFILLNLLGSPMTYVWRDDPGQLHLITTVNSLEEGVATDLAVTVTDGTEPVEGATVCLWKSGEAFSLIETDADGNALFQEICLTETGMDSLLYLTAVKRRAEVNQFETTVVSYLPDQLTIEVNPSSTPIVTWDSVSFDPSGDGAVNPGESVDIWVTAINTGGQGACDVYADIRTASGFEFIREIHDSLSYFPDMAMGEKAVSLDPFVVEIEQNAENYSEVDLELTFHYSSESGDHSWTALLPVTIYSEDYYMPVLQPSVCSTGTRSVEVQMDHMVLVNRGLGEGRNLCISAGNLYPPEPYMVNSVNLESLQPSSADILEGGLVLCVFPDDSTSPWLSGTYRNCWFDVTVESEGGAFTARTVNVQMVNELQGDSISIPSNPAVYETDQDRIGLVWEHYGEPAAREFYVYYSDGNDLQFAYPMPVPVGQSMIEGLMPETGYEIRITAIDSVGRESPPSLISAGTTRMALPGWPMQLDGSVGGGAAASDIDGDGVQELIAVSSFGRLYIIGKNGGHLELDPPPGYDFDRFLGCAAGDLDNDSLEEIIVTCQKDYESQDMECVTLLLYEFDGISWSVDEIARTQVNEHAAAPTVAGTPVIFQADTGSSLEIALRTKGRSPGKPHLYVWRYDAVSNSWKDFNSDFPLELQGSLYSAPTAVDFDGDGLQEILAPNWGTSGVGTAVRIVDFHENGDVSVTLHNLGHLDSGGEIARTFGTLAAASENGGYYIAGVARTEAASSDHKQIFVCSIETDPVGLQLIWTTGWLNCSDFYANMPGPSIGDVDLDQELEVLYTLNGGNGNQEGVLRAWDLADGMESYSSQIIPFNPIIAEGGSYIRSQPVTGGASSVESGRMGVFTGFSSMLCGFDPSCGSTMMPGFPTCSRDGAWSAPVLCDLDTDGCPEILHVDYSGVATLYEWSEGIYTEQGWHMYQCNPHRDGFYTGGGLNTFDISLTDAWSSGERETGSGSSMMVVRLEVRGSPGNPDRGSGDLTAHSTGPAVGSSPGFGHADLSISSNSPERNVPNISAAHPGDTRIPLLETERPCFKVNVYCDGVILGSATLPLEDGTHVFEIPLAGRTGLGAGMTVVADPDDRYPETDESNNALNSTNHVELDDQVVVTVPSPTDVPCISIASGSVIPPDMSVMIYTLDGRLVERLEAQSSGPEDTHRTVLSGSLYPAGVYLIRINGLAEDPILRKVVVLN